LFLNLIKMKLEKTREKGNANLYFLKSLYDQTFLFWNVKRQISSEYKVGFKLYFVFLGENSLSVLACTIVVHNIFFSLVTHHKVREIHKIY
jgi:hypothetical protein